MGQVSLHVRKLPRSTCVRVEESPSLGRTFRRGVIGATVIGSTGGS